MIEDALNRLRILLGLGDRRLRGKLGLGDRRRPHDQVKEQASVELDRLAWIKWKGDRHEAQEHG